MSCNHYIHTVTSQKPFDEAVAAVEQKAADKGFRVLHTHDVAATLAEKGFPREPMKIIEVCNAKYASDALSKDPEIAVMLPCPISVYLVKGKTHITTALPSSLTLFFPTAGIEALASEVETAVLEIIQGAL